MSYVSVFINAIVVALMAVYVYENERRMGEMSVRHDLTVLALETKLVDETKDMKQLLSTKAGIEKLTEIGNHQLKLQDKALMAMYVYENQRRNGEVSARLDRIEKELEVEIFAESKERKKIHMIQDQIEDMKHLMSKKAGIEDLSKVENQQNADIRKLAEIENQQIAGTRKLAEVEHQQNAGTRKLAEIENQQKAGTIKITTIENQQLKSNEKGVTYIRWGKTLCDGPNTETIYSGQVGGGHNGHTGASVNYICLPNKPEVAQPLKSHDAYAYLYGAEYEIYDYNQPQGIRSGINQHDVACAACLAKGKISSILIPGRKTCYNGWTKEYEGVLMAGYHSHAAASEFACVDRDTEAIAGGSKNENGKLFYPVKTVCGSLKCPPYASNTEVLCVVCSK